MLTELVSQWALEILDRTQYVGAAALMAAESMILPVPSEAVMPFVGFQVADGKWDLGLAILATSIGSLVGSLLSYAMGYYGGRPFVLSVGKYLLLNVHDLERAERFFHAREGAWTIFLARFVPVVRHLVSIPAGTGRMPLLPFCLASVAGATLWNGFLLWVGMQLREQWTHVQSYSHQIDIGIVAMLGLGAVWFWRSRRR
ncbi:MAG: DedA family protein [Gammaproteobacteria bacterium]|jgi:membrane protein DedA with SNARE-associated domain|nr:DedA family protein [Gammaproteobacteria bacterium]